MALKEQRYQGGNRTDQGDQRHHDDLNPPVDPFPPRVADLTLQLHPCRVFDVPNTRIVVLHRRRTRNVPSNSLTPEPLGFDCGEFAL